MKFSLSEQGVRGVVLDIEGTTTPISFVHDTLFRYARKHTRARLEENEKSGELNDAVALLKKERASLRVDGDLATFVEHLMDQDSKSTGLKMLQGKIWERGYNDRTLLGTVFPDVPKALSRWRIAGIDLAIYSSGSALAQKLLFGHTRFGDLTPLFSAFFDTEVGAKRAAASYKAIARAMKHKAKELLFVSDVTEELDAARSAGFKTLLCIRPGNALQEAPEAIRSFDEIVA